MKGTTSRIKAIINLLPSVLCKTVDAVVLGACKALRQAAASAAYKSSEAALRESRQLETVVTASIDQSKLRRAGHNKRPALKAGRYKKVNVRVSNDCSCAAGLSAAAKVGGAPPNMYSRWASCNVVITPSKQRILHDFQLTCFCQMKIIINI